MQILCVRKSGWQVLAHDAKTCLSCLPFRGFALSLSLIRFQGVVLGRNNQCEETYSIKHYKLTQVSQVRNFQELKGLKELSPVLDGLRS